MTRDAEHFSQLQERELNAAQAATGKEARIAHNDLAKRYGKKAEEAQTEIMPPLEVRA